MLNSNSPFQIQGFSVAPGKSQKFEVPISRLSTGTQLSLPATILNGKYSGPKLLLSAAIHGDELNGIEIVRRILSETDPRTLRGTIIATPVVNVFGYLTQTRYLPDRRDLNRSFPGSKSGSLAAQIAHLFLQTFVSRADFGIDFHTGSGGRTNLAQVRGNFLDEPTREAALVFGAPAAIQARERANSLRAIAAKRGLPMLVFEGGESLRFDPEAIRFGVEGVSRVMIHLGMKVGTIDPPKRPSFVAESSTWLRTSRGGLFHPTTQLGDRVKASEPLGVTMDIYGRIRTRLLAPHSGMVIGIVTQPIVSRGDAVIHLARKAD